MKYVLIAMLICCATIAYSDTLVVGPGQQYETIQDAINAAEDYDYIAVWPLPYGEAYDAIDFLDKTLYIYGIANPKINGGNSQFVVNMNSAWCATFTGFIVTGSASSIGINCRNESYLEVRDNIVENVGQGIYISDCPYIVVQNNQLRENVTGCYISNVNSVSDIVHLNSNNIYDNNIGVYIDEIYCVSLLANRINSNYTGISMSNNYNTAHIMRSTISNNSNGIVFGAYSYNTINNSIIWQNDVTFTNTPAALDITYSCIEDDYPGTGNINRNPKFCMEGYYSYHLLEGSPCIDSGDPNETDLDGTRLDMGCYPSTTDIKPLKGNHWNYVSFPRLEREGNEPVIAYLLLEDMIPFPEMMTLMFSSVEVLIYEEGLWSNTVYPIISDNGYQLNPQEDGSYILPEPGSRLPSDHTKIVYPGQRNWIGYWLPMTQSYQFALGDQLDHVTSICAEDWFVYKINGQWYGMSTATSEPGTFKYGKGYAIVVDEQFELHWNSLSISEPYEKEETEFFTYEDKPNYEMIEIEYIENGENILEVGIYQGDVCVGASKVEGYPVQLMAYTDAINRSDNLSFELVSGGRNIRKIDIVWKYNFETEQYESTTLHPFENQFSLIKLGKSGENIPEEPLLTNLSNYPNPFNPTTTIKFTTTEHTEHTELNIYNMKGQKVKQLVSGQLSAGKHSVIWDGRDENNNPVSSGIYLYRLETADKVISKKMILIK